MYVWRAGLRAPSERLASTHPNKWSGTGSRFARLELAEKRRQGDFIADIAAVHSEGRLGSATDYC